MDISFWTNLNPKTEVVPITAVKYKNFTALARYFIPGGTYLRPYTIGRWANAQAYVDWRKKTARNYRSAMGSWHVPFGHQHNQHMNPNVLDHFKSILTNPAYNIKFRIEEPYVTVYGVNEQHLRDIATLIGHYDNLRRVEIPQNDNDVELLKAGVLFRKTDSGYKYKVTLRDSWSQSDNITASIAQVLFNQGDNVQISRNIVNKLTLNNRKRYYYTGIWFYANDLSFITFLQLIQPNCVLKVEEMVVRQ